MRPLAPYLLAGLAGIGLVSALALVPNATGTDATPEPLAKLLRERNALGTRVNGALLDTQAHVAKKDDGTEVVQLQWTLDYKGPRPPLVVLPPVLGIHPSAGHVYTNPRGNTCAYFLSAGANGGEAFILPVTMDGYRDGPLFPEQEHEFTVIPAGEKATGIIELPLSLVAKKFKERWPLTFTGKAPWPLYVQLYHRPSGRGPEDLDAWTGELFSRAVRLSPTERVAAIPLPPRRRRPEPKPIKAPADDRGPDSITLLQRLAGRKRGVLLDADADIVVDDAGQKTVRIRWSLNYEGRRQPLTILRPALNEATIAPYGKPGWETRNFTRVNFHAPIAPEGMHRFSLVDPDMSWTKRMARADQFISVPKGQTRSGGIESTVSDILAGFRREYGEQVANEIRVLYVQIEHATADRGERFEKDAWVGRLYSPLLNLDLNREEHSGMKRTKKKRLQSESRLQSNR